MKYRFFVIFLFIFIQCSFAAAENEKAPSLSGYDIAKIAYNAEDGDDVKALIQMEIVKPDGKIKTRSLAMARKDYGADNRSLIFFTEPADVKGTSFLTWNYSGKEDSDQWLYLPALKRVKRISATGKSKSFMGSDFSYEDFEKRSLQKDTWHLLREEPVQNVPCYVIEGVSKNKSETISKRIVWVRTDNFLVTRTDSYDSEGTLLKRFTTSDITNVQGIESILFFKMEDIKNGGYSTMRLAKIRYNNQLEDQMFTVEGMKR